MIVFHHYLVEHVSKLRTSGKIQFQQQIKITESLFLDLFFGNFDSDWEFGGFDAENIASFVAGGDGFSVTFTIVGNGMTDRVRILDKVVCV